MKPFYKDLLMSCLFGLLIPGILLTLGAALRREENPPEPTVARIVSNRRTVSVLTGENVADMGLEDYLTGVVLAEMPASFEEEARKAQAVVARTYTMRACTGKPRHENAQVCTDSACCQAYISTEAYLEAGGTWENVEKMRNAVADTEGYVLTYEGELIEATYFSCSGGMTEDAAAVWGTDVPYLQSVESPGEENAAHFSDTVVFSLEEFQRVLSRELEGKPADWLGAVTRTEGGGVDTMVIGGQTYKGTELRKLLDLRSTAFSMTVKPQQIEIVTSGYGHRVGMSQYGADAMAVLGKNYGEILAHYYPGAELEKLAD